MEATLLQCGQCESPIDGDSLNRSEPVVCDSCGSAIVIHIFPALLRDVPTAGGTGVAAVDGESACFYHPAKMAVLPCDHCGRYLCALCDVEFGTKHLCPACIKSAGEEDRALTVHTYKYYDSMALALAILPIITVWFTLFTAPLALYIVVRYWRRPLSAVSRRRWRFVLAAAVALLQMAVWAFFFVSLTVDLMQ